MERWQFFQGRSSHPGIRETGTMTPSQNRASGESAILGNVVFQVAKHLRRYHNSMGCVSFCLDFVWPKIFPKYTEILCPASVYGQDPLSSKIFPEYTEILCPASVYGQDPLSSARSTTHPNRVEELMPQVADLINRRSKRERIKRKAACPGWLAHDAEVPCDLPRDKQGDWETGWHFL